MPSQKDIERSQDASGLELVLPDDVTLRWVEDAPDHHERGLAWLSSREQARVETFGSEKRRREFVLGRYAGRSLLAEHLGIRPEDVPLDVADSGAPDVDVGALHLSIAHTHPYAVAVAARRRVGVDVERIRERRPDLYRFVLHPDEYDLLDRLPLDHDRIQILSWALKEAVLKGLRTGFRLSPKKLRLDLDWSARGARILVEEEQVWEARFEERAGCFLVVAYADE